MTNIKDHTTKVMLIIYYLILLVFLLTIFAGILQTQVNKNWDNDINMLSTNSGTGSPKTTDYYPKGATKEYVFKRGNKMILETNVEIDEFANFQSIKQINFETGSEIKDGYAIIDIPYSVCEDIKIYQVEQGGSFSTFELNVDKFEIDGKEYLLIKFTDTENTTKVTIDYKKGGDLENYLKENPFEFVVTSGDEDASFTNFIKENSHTYSVKINAKEKTKIELPTLYYSGYKIICETPSETRNIDGYRNENGFLEIEIDGECTIKVKFDPAYVKVSNIISVVGILGFIFATVGLYYYEKKNKLDLTKSPLLN